VSKALIVLATAAVVGLGGLGALWLEHRTEITLPTPTGSFAVGRAIYDWTDANPDPLAPVPGTKRELLVWIWYPAATGQSVTLADYVPAQMQAATRPSGALLQLLTRDVSKVRGHSLRDAAVSLQQPSYPVVIMRAGASAGVSSYSTLAEDLASHGYVVVGFDAPYRTFAVTFPDGRVMRRTPQNNPENCEEQPLASQAGCVNELLEAWCHDIAFVLDRLNSELNAGGPSGRFTGRLDLARVGVFGHSFGGATAAQFCHEDSRCRAGIDVDGQLFGSVVQAGLHQPFLFLLSGHGDSSDPETRQIQANIQSVYDRLPPDGRLRAEIRGANHFLFSDDVALLKSHIVMRLLRMIGIVGIDGPRQLAITAYCVRSFFDVYLKGEGKPPLRISSPLYREVRVLP
jgi:dienelactone hydrolase